MEVKYYDGVTFCAVGLVGVMVWKEPASPARWRWLADNFDQLIAQYPDGAINFDVIHQSSRPPDAQLRNEMSAYFKALGPKMRKLIAVPVGDPTWARIVKIIAWGILFISGQLGRFELVGDIATGIKRVRAAAPHDAPSAADLETAVALSNERVFQPETESPAGA